MSPFKLNPVTVSALLFATVALSSCQQSPLGNVSQHTANQTTDVPAYWPKLSMAVKDSDAIETRVTTLLATMTTEQKVAQIIQPEIRDITVEDMRRYGFGSYLNGGGAFPNNDKHAEIGDWVALAEAMYQASVDESLDGSTIPTMWGTDAVHGHNNVIGATLFPHNIGLGAMHNPELMQQVANVTAREVLATGIDWIFAPTVAVVQDDRWGRTYESYSENPTVVKAYAAAIVRGLQGDLTTASATGALIDDAHVISTVKHFIGDGGTVNGDDQGNNIASEKDLFDIHAQGYVGGLSAGAQSVMASFNSWHGEKAHGHKYLLTDVLKQRMGFDGFVVGDWNGHGQVKGCSNVSCPQAFNAGLDMFMVPTDAWRLLLQNTLQQVRDGTISEARLNDAVRRILRVKVRAGLLDKPSPQQRLLAGKQSIIGSEQHRAIAQQAVRESLVLLKNTNNLLPLAAKQHILVAGDAAHNIGKQSGGWTITWQGTGNENSDFPGASSIYDGIKTAVNNAGGKTTLSVDGSYTEKPDVAIVVFGEEPYAEGHGDLDNLDYQRGSSSDLALLKRLQSEGIPVVSLFITGRPLWINPELNASDAFVVAWLPGSEGKAVADVILRKANGEVNYPITGKLSFSWPNNALQTDINIGSNQTALFSYGYGLTFNQPDSTVYPLSENAGFDSSATQTTHVIFNGQAQKPWKTRIDTAGETQTMTSNVLNGEALSVRTTDRLVQEDALYVDWSDAGKILFSSDFPEDMRDLAEGQPMLVFDYQLAEKSSTELALAFNCATNCQHQRKIAADLVADNQWHTFAIPLQCLFAVKDSASLAQHLAQVYSPFALQGSKGSAMTLSNVRIEHSKEKVNCN